MPKGRYAILMVALLAAALFATPESELAARAAGLPAGTEIPELRTEYSNTYSTGDGQLSTVIADLPVNRLTESGEWEPYETDDVTTILVNQTNYHTGTVYGNGGSPVFWSPDYIYFRAGSTAMLQYRGWARWPTDIIPDGSTVSAVVCSAYCYNTYAPFYRLMQMQYDPPPQTANTIYNDIGDGSIYVNSYSLMSGWNTYNLGSTAAGHLQTQLGANWFAVGFYEYETGTSSWYGYCYGWGGGTLRPRLRVTYNPPIPDPGVTSIACPDSIPYCDTFDVTVTVRNYGSAPVPAGWWVYCDILDSLNVLVDHESLQVLTPLAIGENRPYIFQDKHILEPCRHRVKGKVYYPPDLNRVNDSLMRNVWSQRLDFEIVGLSFYPPPPYTPTTVLDSIDVIVHNNGLHHRINGLWVHKYLIDPNGDTVFVDSFVVNNLLPCETIRDVEPYGLPLPVPGGWTYLVDAPMVKDHDPSNNTKDTTIVTGMPDIGVQAILAPTGRVDTGTVVIPSARVHNFGDVPFAFRAWFIMNDPTDVERYREYIDVPPLAVGADLDIVWPGYNVGGTEGTWASRCSVSADVQPNNDFLDGTFEVSARPPWPDLWVEVKKVPGTIPVKDGGCLAFNAGNELVYLVKGNKTLEFYSYDPFGDSFSSLADIPAGEKPPKKGCDIIADGDNYLYLTKGNNTLEFWRYDIAGNVWESLPPVPIGPNRKGCKKGTDLSYVTGLDADYAYLLKGYGTEFYRYNVGAAAWDPALTDVPVGAKSKVDEGSFLCWDEASILYFFKAKYNELWPYDLGTATWGLQLPSMPFIHPMVGKKKKAKDGAAGAWYDGEMYATKGGNTCEFWKYNPADSWTGKCTIPQVGSTGKKKRVKTGGDLVSWGGGAFFAMKGNKTFEFWRYMEPVAPFGSQPERSGVMAGRVAVGPQRFDVAPNPLVGGFATVSYSLPKAGPVLVRVHDVTGRVVLDRSLLAARTGALDLDLRSLSSGVYLVRLESDSYTTTRKLVIER